MSESNVNISVPLSEAERWSGVPALPQQREDRLPPEDAAVMWNRIYEEFGANSETARDEAFAAVTLYFLVNGASPSGKYARLVRTAGGSVVPVDSIVKIIGRLEGQIRQFLRSDMKKSYACLKHTSAVKSDRALCDKAERLGVPRGAAWLLADWLRDCEYLTGEEAVIHGKLSEKLISDASVRRRAPNGISHRIEEGRYDVEHDSFKGSQTPPRGVVGSAY